jgi:hypothetical protein
MSKSQRDASRPAASSGSRSAVGRNRGTGRTRLVGRFVELEGVAMSRMRRDASHPVASSGGSRSVVGRNRGTGRTTPVGPDSWNSEVPR